MYNRNTIDAQADLSRTVNEQVLFSISSMYIVVLHAASGHADFTLRMVEQLDYTETGKGKQSHNLLSLTFLLQPLRG